MAGVIERPKFTPIVNGTQEANRQGRLFYFIYQFSGILPGSNLDLVANLGNSILVLVDREYTTTSEKLELTSYVGTTYTGGTALPVVNYNSVVSPPVPTTTTPLLNPTISSLGQVFDYSLILGDPGAGNPLFGLPGGGFKSDTLERYLPPDTDFLLRFTNSGTVPMDGVVKFIWYELPPDEPLY